VRAGQELLRRFTHTSFFRKQGATSRRIARNAIGEISASKKASRRATHRLRRLIVFPSSIKFETYLLMRGFPCLLQRQHIGVQRGQIRLMRRLPACDIGLQAGGVRCDIIFEFLSIQR